MDSLKAGDTVFFTHTGQDTVEVVVECVSATGFMMSHFDDSQLKLTSYHPVLDTRNGAAQWMISGMAVPYSFRQTACNTHYVRL